MVSAAHSAANRLNARESTGLSDAQATRRSPSAASARGVRQRHAPTVSGQVLQKNRELGKQSRFIE